MQVQVQVQVKTMIDLQSLDDSAFAELRERVDAEYNRREDLRAADAVAAIPIEVRPVNLRLERLHAGQSLKVRQYDYVRGVAVALHGHSIGSFYLKSGPYRFGDGYACEAFRGPTYCGYSALVHLTNNYWRYEIPQYSVRVIRLLAARIQSAIEAIHGAALADGQPIAWTGYEDGSPVPAGAVKGKVRR